MGMLSRLDHLNDLGVDCLWLMPFFPSPGRDDGYDITDHYGIHPDVGTHGDFTEMMRTAGDRGIRVVLDLVVNHTSVDHPWFQSARKDPDSPFRDFYVWCDEPPADWEDQIVFPGEQDGIWSYDEEAGAWYLHHFYRFQPDLNFANPAVREEFRTIIGLWLRQGVSGFRIDAAPFLIDLSGTGHELDMETAHAFLRELRDFAIVRQGNVVLLGEVDVGLSTIADYFGACLLTLGEVTRCDFAKYPNVKRWLDTVKQLPSWSKVNEALYGYADYVKALRH